VAAHVLRLRLALLVGALRGEHAVRSAIALLASVAATVAVCVAILGLGEAPLPTAETVIVLGAAALMLAFFIGPMLTGTPDQLDPRRFWPFGVDERRLGWTLVLASLISVPSIALIAVTTCVVIIVVQAGVAWGAAALFGVIGVLSIALAARIGMAISAIMLPERRSRELTVLFTLPVIVIAFPVAAYFASLRWDGQVPPAVHTATSIVGFSPLAAPQAFLFHLAAGETSAAWTSGVIAVVSVGAMLLLWNLLVKRLLTASERPYATRERSGLGWFGSLPANAFGAVAARSLVYWLRDRRYIVNLLVVPIAGVLTVFPLLVAGVPLWIAALVPVPLMALFFGWMPHNDVAYDSTALWMHIASGVRGLADRFGRLVPLLLVALPVLAIGISVTLGHRRLAPHAAADRRDRRTAAVGTRHLEHRLGRRPLCGVTARRQPVPAAAALVGARLVRRRAHLRGRSAGERAHDLDVRADAHRGRPARSDDVLGRCDHRCRGAHRRRRDRRGHLRTQRRAADGVRRDHLSRKAPRRLESRHEYSAGQPRSGWRGNARS